VEVQAAQVVPAGQRPRQPEGSPRQSVGPQGEVPGGRNGGSQEVRKSPRHQSSARQPAGIEAVQVQMQVAGVVRNGRIRQAQVAACGSSLHERGRHEHPGRSVPRWQARGGSVAVRRSRQVRVVLWVAGAGLSTGAGGQAGKVLGQVAGSRVAAAGFTGGRQVQSPAETAGSAGSLWQQARGRVNPSIRVVVPLQVVRARAGSRHLVPVPCRVVPAAAVPGEVVR